jgi:hypothetical protein
MVQEPSSPKPTSSRRTRAFAKTRWLHQSGGRDLGPYTPQEIIDLIQGGQLTHSNKVREVGQRRWHKVVEVKPFRDVIRALDAERKQKEKERELDRVETEVRTKRKAPVVGGLVTIVLIIGAVGYFAWNWIQGRQSFPPSNYTQLMWKDLELTEVPSRAYVAKPQPIQWADETVRMRQKRRTKPRMKTSLSLGKGKSNRSGVMTGSADDLEPKRANTTVQEMDFMAEGGRELTSGEVNRVVRQVTPQLVRCAQKQANRQTAFPGTTVRFTLKKSGSAGSIQIGKNGRRSSAFVQCVRGKLRNVRVEPFTGAERVISVPLKVGR